MRSSRPSSIRGAGTEKFSLTKISQYRSAQLVDQRVNHPVRIQPDQLANRHHLGHIQPAFAAFVLGHERLGLAQDGGYVHLAQLGRAAGLDEHLQQYLIGGRMRGLHDGRLWRGRQPR